MALVTHLGVSKNQGHLIWTQNTRIPEMRTPKQDTQISETPICSLVLHYCCIPASQPRGSFRAAFRSRARAAPVSSPVTAVRSLGLGLSQLRDALAIAHVHRKVRIPPAIAKSNSQNAIRNSPVFAQSYPANQLQATISCSWELPAGPAALEAAGARL